MRVWLTTRVPLVIGVVALLLGIASWAGGIGIHAKMTSVLVDELFRARFIENTVDTGEKCEGAFLGDLTCGWNRYFAWKLSDWEKNSFCLDARREPYSRAVKDASGWFEPSSSQKKDEEAARRASECRQGQKQNVYVYSVRNAVEFLLYGADLAVEEVGPIPVLKHVEKHEVNRARWDSDGVAEYQESVQYEILDKSLLEEKIVIVNPALFSELQKRVHGRRIVAENVIAVSAALIGYNTILNLVTPTAISFLPGFNVEKFLTEVYRSGLQEAKFTAVMQPSGTRVTDMTLPKFLAHAECVTTLVSVQDIGNTGGYLACSKAYSDAVNLGVLDPAGIFTLANPLTFYEFEKGCESAGDSRMCTVTDICGPAPAADFSTEEKQKHAACLKGTLDLKFVQDMFKWVAEVGKLEDKDELSKRVVEFLETCEIKWTLGSVNRNQVPREVCGKIQDQLMRAGRAFLARYADPVKNGFTLEQGEFKDRALTSVGKRIYPFFVYTTVGQALGYNGKQVSVALGKNFNFKLLTDTDHAELENLPVIERYMSSRFGDLGLGSWRSFNGIQFACHYDFNCMAQPLFQTERRCIPGVNNCNPPAVQGFDIARVPAPVFSGSGSSRSDRAELFVADFFVRASFEARGTADWRGVQAKYWTLDKVAGGGASACGRSGVEGDENDIDCDSPHGTIFVGSQLSPSPETVLMPFYASSPLFIEQGDSNPDQRNSPYTPQSKVDFYSPLAAGGNGKLSRAQIEKRDLKSHLITEPNLGSTLQGVRRLQVNMRMKGDFPGGLVKAGLDVLVPLFWVEQYDSAKERQVETVKDLQANMDKLVKTEKALLVAGIVVSVLATLLLAARWWKIRHHHRGVLERQGTGDSSCQTRV